ncbi:MAG TPA: Sun protein, partial [Labilithrix sp.]|nr:Sun protein [Labilithrix sp.]
LGSHDGAPPLGLRIEDAATRDEWLERLREARPSATFDAGRVSPHAVLARGAGKTVELPGYAEGAWTPQEEGSQLVALALGARAGEVVLDACAGRGNKTGLLARAVGPTGAVDVCRRLVARDRRSGRRLRSDPRRCAVLRDGDIAASPRAGVASLRR